MRATSCSRAAARRQIADVLGLDAQDQSRFATAVSEIARNAFQYAGGGRAEFGIEDTPTRMLTVRLTDRGPGIARSRGHPRRPLRLTHRHGTSASAARGGSRTTSRSVGARTGHDGRARQAHPQPVPTNRADDRRSRSRPNSTAAATSTSVRSFSEQNQELMRSLEETRGRQVEIERLNRELEETNRGVVALYMELDERALDLARRRDMKSRILSDISHEVRTPLNAILNISRLLMDRMDGDLTPEQERQIRMIRDSRDDGHRARRRSAGARQDGGRQDARARLDVFPRRSVRRAARHVPPAGYLGRRVALVFEDVAHIPELQTDEGKIGQILRNLISNALKFTERGEIRVKAALRDDDVIVFTVTDTGIGIAPENHDLIFQEFSQIENPFQRRSAGRGPRVAAVPEARDLSRRQPHGHE